jgi:hypothetical protein
MKRILFALAAVGLVATVPQVNADSSLGPSLATNHTQQVTNGAWGGVCYYGPNDEYRCRNFTVAESTNWFDGTQETRLEYTFYRSGTNLYGYQSLSCVVDSKSLNVTPNRATFHAVIPDPMASSCVNGGTLCVDGNCTEWLFTVPVVVKGEMTNPGYEQTHVTIHSNRDNESGISSRQQCHGGEAGRIGGGGVSFSTTGGNFLYFPFGYVGQYGQAFGQYLYDTCNHVGD